MKKIINNPENVVNEMLEGMIKAHPNYVKRIEGTEVLVRKDAPIEGKVALVSGGGSGHEPAHAGFIGKGMLSAAVSGEVFTSPTPDQVFRAIKEVDGKKGVLLIIKNYTGDVMNFEMAEELAEAEDIEVKSVIVNDDVAVENSTYTTGRRGIAGTVLVHKIAGAAAEEGMSLDEVQRIANKVIKNIRSMGMSLSSGIVPSAGKPSFILKENEMEMGLGIHGEPGIKKEKLKNADDITKELLDKILDDIKIDKGDEVAVLVNGLGATPLMELYIVNNALNKLLNDKNINVYDSLVGNFMTSLEMAGASISILKLDDELKELLDKTADTIAYKKF